MKEFIIKALDEAYEKVLKSVPEYKSKIVYSESICDLTPAQLLDFAKEHNIPEGATIEGVPNSYDAYEGVALCWSIPIPTTEKGKLSFIKIKFNNNAAWNLVYKTLLENGYKRVGFNTGLLKPFDNTTVYDMYVNREFDRLVEYYSLPFIKTN